jgi:outer membrane usher protein
VRLLPDGEERVLGFDGEAYLRGLEPGLNRIEVTWQGGRCAASLTAEIPDGTVPRLGPVTCAP